MPKRASHNIDCASPINWTNDLAIGLQFLTILDRGFGRSRAVNLARHVDPNGSHGMIPAGAARGTNFYLNGSSQAIDFGQCAALKTTGDFSAACRFRPTTTGGYEIPFGTIGFDGSISSSGWCIGRNASNAEFGVRINSNPTNLAAPVANGTEIVLAFTRSSSGTLVLYANGKPVASTTGTTLSFAYGNNTIIGARNGLTNGAAGDYFTGPIHSAAAWNRVLSRDEMRAVSSEMWNDFPQMLNRIGWRINAATAVGFSPVFRKTFSQVGGRVGRRQILGAI